MYKCQIVLCGFQCHRASGQVWAEVARNLADSLIIPFQVEDYAKKLKDGVDKLENEFGLLMEKNGIELGNFLHIHVHVV